MGLNHNGECGITKYQANVKQPTLIEEFINNGCNIKSISCGDNHSCCVEGRKNLNLVWTFGLNDYKQCDASEERNILIPIVHGAFKYSNIIKGECGKDFTVVLDDRASLKTFGNILIEYDDLSLMESNTSVKDFSVGNDHVIIINDQNKISLVETRRDNKTAGRTTIMLENESFPSLPNDNTLCKIVTTSDSSIMIFEMKNK